MTLLQSFGFQFDARRERVLATLAQKKIDALLVASPANVRYLAGFTGSNGLVLLAPRRAFLFTDPRYTIQASEESDCKVVTVRGPLAKAALGAIKRLKFKHIGIEAQHLKFDTWQYLNENLPPGAELAATRGCVEQARLIKEPAEQDLIRQSVLLNSRVFEAVLPAIRPGMTERDLAAEIEYRMRREGADGPAFETIVAAGPRSALPHAHPTGAALKTNQLLLIDMGTMLAGYASDMTRTVFLGAASRNFERVYRAVLEAQGAALDAVRAGVAAGTVDRAARSVLAKHGLEHAFVHSTGHGLGLEIHEPPRVGRAERTRLAAGMAITVEPGAYLDGLGGVRIEDTVLVTENGCEVLTPASKKLTIL
jgi:Xaa-Pro aminopeptidase